MEVILYNQKAEDVGKVNLPDEVFGLEFNKDLVYQIVTSQKANQRQVIAHTKGRGQVRGGGKKPWRQKGTGRARHGSIRSPIWKGGGVTFGPTKERNFKKKINKKMARKALLMVLSSKVKDNQVFVLNNLGLENPKTKEMAAVVKSFTNIIGKRPSLLLVIPAADENIKRSSRNIPRFKTVEAKDINPLEVLSSKYILLVKDAVEVLSKRLVK